MGNAQFHEINVSEGLEKELTWSACIFIRHEALFSKVGEKIDRPLPIDLRRLSGHQIIHQIALNF